MLMITINKTKAKYRYNNKPTSLNYRCSASL
jgi:hypothetical protein